MPPIRPIGSPAATIWPRRTKILQYPPRISRRPAVGSRIATCLDPEIRRKTASLRQSALSPVPQIRVAITQPGLRTTSGVGLVKTQVKVRPLRATARLPGPSVAGVISGIRLSAKAESVSALVDQRLHRRIIGRQTVAANRCVRRSPGQCQPARASDSSSPVLQAFQSPPFEPRSARADPSDRRPARPLVPAARASSAAVRSCPRGWPIAPAGCSNDPVSGATRDGLQERQKRRDMPSSRCELFASKLHARSTPPAANLRAWRQARFHRPEPSAVNAAIRSLERRGPAS